ncbi:MAG TPA: pyridoxal phosphate-dependent aminotransferase [Verrucomicrobiae bacterium]|jgi:aspartate aminotransferase|nr:pyridoxal phosphate-dependent aminotransferase [Verrucomicrobiae bacterium]
MATLAAIKQFSDRVNRIEISATMAVVAEAAKLKAGGADLVEFGAGEPHFPTPQHIKDAAIAAIQQDFTKYTTVPGMPELRAAIVKRHAADFGSSYKPEETIASTGGKLSLFNAIQVLVDHGDEVILPVPYWVSFKDIVEYAGGKCVYVETDEGDGFQLTAEMIERSITPRTRAIIINSPNNPSGAVLDPAEFTAILRLAHKRGIYVIADECYVYLNYTGKSFSAASVAEAREHLVIAGSLSKTYSMTGWRLGYAMAPAPIINAMTKLQSQSTSSTAQMVQKAGVAALNGPQQCVAEMKAEWIRLRDHTLKGLATIPDVSCVRPEGAFYVYPNVSSYFGKSGVNSAADVAKRLLHEAHVVTVPGEAFGTREHIRLSYATSPAEIDRGIKRMNEWFGKL